MYIASICAPDVPGALRALEAVIARARAGAKGGWAMSETSIPFVLGEEPARAKRDGCGCLVGVRCIHFDGRLVWFGTPESFRRRHEASCTLVNRSGYQVVIQPDLSPFDTEPCGLCGHAGAFPVYDQAIQLFEKRVVLYHGHDHRAALAAFHEAEERLLRGEPS